MAKSRPPFEIHVDPSCMSEDLEEDSTMPSDQVTSSETHVHDESCSDENTKESQQPVEDHEVTDTPTEVAADAQKQEDEARERRIEKIQAEIRSAARAVVASIEQDDFDNEGSVLITRPEENYDQEAPELTHEEEAEPTYGDGMEVPYESEADHRSENNSDRAGDSSSHHDGDIDDDVFSHSNRSSNRSSLNSCHDLDNIEVQKLLTSPVVGEDAASASENDIMSRVPSDSSYIRSAVENNRTPSKVLARPPFRTPSSVRAMQMSSPTQSVFSSPRSAKRHMPTVSRLGTPTSHSSPTKRTPTRFKIKKEYPLVLLHVTVLPLQWSYSHLMTSSLIPDSLHSVKESWRLLQNKIGDTVLERGVLLAHPQDSYEVLEERLLEALELPVRPRAKILKCGHYMGPVESDAASSDDEHGQSWAVEKRDARDWCDVCRRNVRLEDMGEMEGLDKRFRIKIYASNGLMRAGAWAAAWKEMERVDVEIEPLVEANLHDDLERLAIAMATEESPEEQHQEEDDGFIDEDMMIENVPHHDDHDTQDQERHEAEIRMREEEVRSRMAEEEEMRQKMADDEHLRQLRLAEEEETKKRLEEEERQKINRMAEELGIRQRMNRDEGMRRSILEADRMRDVYDREPLTPDRHEMPRQTPSHRGTRGDESLSELLIAAFKVAIRDSRNVAIVVLSSFVLLLALRPASPSHNPAPIIMNESPAVAQVTTTVFTEVVTTATHSVAPVVANPPPVIELSPVIITETVAAPHVTTTIIQEKTVTEKVPVPSISQEQPSEVVKAEKVIASPVAEISRVVEMPSESPTILAQLKENVEEHGTEDSLKVETAEPTVLNIVSEEKTVEPSAQEAVQEADEEAEDLVEPMKVIANEDLPSPPPAETQSFVETDVRIEKEAPPVLSNEEPELLTSTSESGEEESLSE